MFLKSHKKSAFPILLIILLFISLFNFNTGCSLKDGREGIWMLVGRACKSDGTDCKEKYIDGVYDSTPGRPMDPNRYDKDMKFAEITRDGDTLFFVNHDYYISQMKSKEELKKMPPFVCQAILPMWKEEPAKKYIKATIVYTVTGGYKIQNNDKVHILKLASNDALIFGEKEKESDNFLKFKRAGGIKNTLFKMGPDVNIIEVQQ